MFPGNGVNWFRIFATTSSSIWRTASRSAFTLRHSDPGNYFGAYADSDDKPCYTGDSEQWFDLSIISRYGKQRADALKFQNRRTYQALIFDGLGLRFGGESYLLPAPIETGLSGDVAVAADAGPVWPMKKWAYYQELKQRLEEEGLTVNVLRCRRDRHCWNTWPMCKIIAVWLEGIVSRCILHLGTGTPCVTLLTCTSPWEIYDYGIQTKIVSPLLGEILLQTRIR